MQTQLTSLDLKTDTNLTTLAGLQTSIDAQLLLAGSSLQTLTTDQNAIKTQLDSIQTQANQNTTATTQLQTQMDLLKIQNQALTDLAIAIEPKNLIYKDSLGNLDLLGGKLEASEITAGILSIKVVDQTKPTIGQAVIIKVSKDENNDGIDDITGSDGKSVQVQTRAVEAGSKVFTSFVKNPGSSSWVEKTKDSQEDYNGFEIKLQEPVKENVSVDWWIVQVK